MTINKKLLIVAVLMFPLVVISFLFKNNEANFILEKNKENTNSVEKNNSSQNNSPIKQKEYSVKVLVNNEIKELPLENYIIGVVAGEMPASFDIEALKAQAVASRTYALFKKSTNEMSQYDLTNDTSSQVYIEENEMRKKWGNDFQKYFDKIKSAVDATKGEIITYKGEIIEAFYFAMSSGNTQGAQEVFNQGSDYLVKVESIYDNNSLKNFEYTMNFSIDDFKKKLGLDCNQVVIDYINRNESDYVSEISLCSKKFKGISFRFALGLRSNNFQIEIDDDVRITTLGYGHGVGMSQYGAHGYALHGYDYQDIIKHYYKDVEIKNIKDV